MVAAYTEHAKIFKAFADEKRLRILEILRNGEQCACVLTEALNMPQSTLSYHMKILCESGVVKGREEGKWTYYSISNSGGQSAAALLLRLTTQN
ncbi:ArsR/SmtB family transcription factor [Cloacibacillus evryensis]|uniref:ArsR/SmtB family transcription factor n=1 Tax=Cloacibacillus evryensis TaxID=508460 RepID=UPI00241D9C8D|nr:metalloregulator ArsR/SmtB family transcription factor [Cloacibacillus evryensis]